jgi:hypothetical protein
MKILLATTTVLALAVWTAAGANIDANHPDLSNPSDKADYEQNPALYSKGWHDGWIWSAALSDKSQTYSDVCENICRKRYGDIDTEGSQARTKFLGFLSAAAFVREHAEGAADTQEKGTDQEQPTDSSLERAIAPEERAVSTEGRATDTQERGLKKKGATDNSLERAIAAEERVIRTEGQATDTTPGETIATPGAATDTTTRARHAPVADDWNACPGGWVTEEAIKQLVSEPNNCKFDSATEPQLAQYNGKKCWLVVVQFRTRNPGGGEVTDVADVYMVGSDPLSIIDARLRE